MTSASALLLVLRHFYYMGRHVPDQCFSTPASAMALLLRGQASLCSVVRHSCSCYGAFVTWASTSLFSTVPYLQVLIMLCSSHSLLPVYAGKYLYVVYMNNMIHETKSTQFCSVL